VVALDDPHFSRRQADKAAQWVYSMDETV